MPPTLNTGNAYLDGLYLTVGAHAAVVNSASDLRDVLIYAAAALDQGFRLVVSEATIPVSSTIIRYVSPDLLSDLNYPDQAAYEAQLAAGIFHAEDLAMVSEHIRHSKSDIYNARMLRGDGSGGYRDMEIQGWTVATTASTTYRVTVLRRL